MIDDDKARIAREVARQNLKRKPELSTKTKMSFNFGAAAFPFLYNIIYKRTFLAITFILITISTHIADKYFSASAYSVTVKIATFLTVALAIYAGITGNVAAYKARAYDDEEDFKKSQSAWLPFAIIAFIFHLVILPIQLTGNYNNTQMKKVVEARVFLGDALKSLQSGGKVIGVDIVGENIPEYLVKYMKGHLESDKKTVTTKDGITYEINGYQYECDKRAKNTYHSDKTACARITLDLNGKESPNVETPADDAKKVNKLLNSKVRLHDRFVFFLYNDDIAPMEGSVEQFILRKYGKD